MKKSISNRTSWIVIILALIVSGFFVWLKVNEHNSIPEPVVETPVVSVATVSKPVSTYYPQKKPACFITASNTVKIFSRPSTGADVFGSLRKGEVQGITGITGNGWYAFEPGVAQAANVGVFRNRYIAPGGPFALTGTCTNLEKLVTLPATTCFDMALVATPIYSKADIKSRIINTIPKYGYVHAIATHNQGSADSSTYFVQVNTDQGSMTSGTLGWISGSDVNFNGHCSSLPKK